MNEENLLFEIKPKYTIPYIIIIHFWDILFFVGIMVILRYAKRFINSYNYSVCNDFNI